MSRATTAVTLSALVFPGAGQLYLGHQLRGCMFIAPALGAAWYFFSQVFARARAIVDELTSGRMPPDPVHILARIHEQGQDASLGTNIAGAVMLACWIVSMVDAWYLGRHANAIAAPTDTPGHRAAGQNPDPIVKID